METGIGFTEQSVCRQHRTMFAARGVGGQLGPGPINCEYQKTHALWATVFSQVLCLMISAETSKHNAINICVLTCVLSAVFFLPSVETLVGQMACNRRMPHMYNRQLPLSLQGAVVSLVFPPSFTTGTVTSSKRWRWWLVLFICSFPKGFCLPTGKWYSSTMKRSWVTSFRVEVVVAAWLITQIAPVCFFAMCSPGMLFTVECCASSRSGPRLTMVVSAATFSNCWCFVFFLAHPTVRKPERQQKWTLFLVHVLHEWVANNLIIRGTFVLEPIPRLQP